MMTDYQYRQFLKRIIFLLAGIVALAMLVGACVPASGVPGYPTPAWLPFDAHVAVDDPLEAGKAFFSNHDIAVELARCLRIVDGDTIVVEMLDGPLRGEIHRVRYIGVDAPETVHPSRPVEHFGPEASEANRRLVEDKMIFLERDVSQPDRFGRLLRYVWIPSSVGPLMVNAILVYDGYAFAVTYPPDVRYQDWFLELERKARQEDRGLWGMPAE